MVKCAELPWVNKENSPEEVTELNLKWGRRSLSGRQRRTDFPRGRRYRYQGGEARRILMHLRMQSLRSGLVGEEVSEAGRLKSQRTYIKRWRGLEFILLMVGFVILSPRMIFPPDWIQKVLMTGSLSQLFVFPHWWSSRQKGTHLSFGGLGFLAVFSSCRPGTVRKQWIIPLFWEVWVLNLWSPYSLFQKKLSGCCSKGVMLIEPVLKLWSGVKRERGPAVALI